MTPLVCQALLRECWGTQISLVLCGSRRGLPPHQQSSAKAALPSPTSLPIPGGPGFTEDRALLHLLPWLIPGRVFASVKGCSQPHGTEGQLQKGEGGEVAAVREHSGGPGQLGPQFPILLL